MHGLLDFAPGGGLLTELPTRTASAGVLSSVSGGGNRSSMNPRALVSPNLIPTSRHGSLKPGQSAAKRHSMASIPPATPYVQEWMLIGQDLISDGSAASTPVCGSPLPQKVGIAPPFSTGEMACFPTLPSISNRQGCSLSVVFFPKF